MGHRFSGGYGLPDPKVLLPHASAKLKPLCLQSAVDATAGAGTRPALAIELQFQG